MTEAHQLLIQYRYIPLVKELRARAFRTAVFFHTSRIIVTVGSLIVPALLSIQYTDGLVGPSNETTDISRQIYWATWLISLLVTMCNGLLTLFKLDKRYFFLHTTLEQLTSEGWQYLMLTSKYSGFYTPGQKPSHQNQFIYFAHSVEKIRMRQVEEEYYKLAEMHAHGPTGPTSSAAAATGAAGANGASAAPGAAAQSVVPASSLNTIVNSLLPHSPLKAELAKVSPEVAKLLEQIQGEDGGVSSAASTATAPSDDSGGGSKKEENPESGENRTSPQMPV